jgi:hypothetical protein
MLRIIYVSLYLRRLSDIGPQDLSSGIVVPIVWQYEAQYRAALLPESEGYFLPSVGEEFGIAVKL